MNFNELIKLVSSENPPNICTDSRAVKSGDIFVAVKGTVSDGHDFIEQAISNGAKYIVCEEKSQNVGCAMHTCFKNGVHSTPYILIEDSIMAAAILAQAAKGNPSSKLINMAVTGTNGKTTVTYLVRSCVMQSGEKCGLIGTVIYDDCSGKSTAAPLTTPDSLTIAEKQAEMIKNGAKYMITEASSHALSQNRLACINFKAAAFTNLTGDHLDYHITKENYLEAKTKLFTSLAADSFAVLNRESPESQYIAKNTKAKIIWYAIEQKADLALNRSGTGLVAKIETMDVSGTVYSLNYMGQSAIVKTPLIGMYNISNHLAAAGLCLGAGLDLKTIAAGLSELKLIPGRLEKVAPPTEGGRDARPCVSTILIDYAHTDDALKNVLSILKPLCKGKLRVIFGCGGDRDKTKRPRMAHVVEQFADFITVTSDNPRTEEPLSIIDDILKGFKKEYRIQNTEYRNPVSLDSSALSSEPIPIIDVVPDRKQAIEMVIKAAGKDDIILIAGKGHEDYQIIGKTKYHFSDKEIAQNCLKQI